MEDKPDLKEIIKEKMKNPQWRLITVIVLTFLILFFWIQISHIGGPEHYIISYSQFIEQLNTNNLESVTLKN